MRAIVLVTSALVATLTYWAVVLLIERVVAFIVLVVSS